MPRIVVNEHYCKGCALCVDVCPESIVAMDTDRLTAKGYHPAVCIDASRCTACTNCAQMCPDVAITVYREVRS